MTWRTWLRNTKEKNPKRFSNPLKNDDKLRKKERKNALLYKKKKKWKKEELNSWEMFKGLAERYKWPNLKKSKKSRAENKRKKFQSPKSPNSLT